MAVVHAAQRNAMPSSDFAVPGKRKLLIHDATHAKLAWQMVERAHGLSAEEKADARRRIKTALGKFGIDTSNYDEKNSNTPYCDACDRVAEPGHVCPGTEQNSNNVEGELGTRSVYGYQSKSDPTQPKSANKNPWTDAVEKMSVAEQEALTAFIPDLSVVDGYQLSTALTAVVGAQLLSNQLALRTVKDVPNQIRCFFSQSVEIKEGKVRIPVARLGTFVHQRYGLVDFKQSDFDDMIRNFENNETGFPPYLRYGHALYPEAVDGEPKIANLERLEQEDTVLYGVYVPISGHEDVVEKVKKSEYEFSSAELTRHAISKHDGRPIGTLLTAHALTNAPFVPDLPRNQVLSEGAAGTPSGGFMMLNLSQHEGATTMKSDEFLSMIDSQLEVYSVSTDARDKIRGMLAGAMKEAGVADVTSKTSGQPGPVYSGGGEGGKQQPSGMAADQPASPESQAVKKPAGAPSEVYTGEGAAAAGDGGEALGHGAALHAAAKNLEKQADEEDNEKMSMFGEFLSMLGNMMKGGKKAAKPGAPEPKDAKGAPEKHSDAAAVAQNLSAGAATIDNSKTAPDLKAQQFSSTEGDTDMKPEEVKALIDGLEQKFSNQLGELKKENETLKTELNATKSVTQQYSANAERARVEARANRLVEAGIAPAVVNAALQLASTPAFAGQQLKLSDGAEPVNAVDALLDILEKTPGENRVSYGQVGQQLSDSTPDPYAEIMARVQAGGQ